MLFASNKYDVQINEIGMKIMGHSCHPVNSPLLKCGTSAKNITNIINTTAAAIITTTTNRNRYVSWQHQQQQQQNLENNVVLRDIIKDNNDNHNLRAFVVRTPIKKKSSRPFVSRKHQLQPVLRLRQGSLFKKKDQKQHQRFSFHKRFLIWHLNSGAI